MQCELLKVEQTEEEVEEKGSKKEIKMLFSIKHDICVRSSFSFLMEKSREEARLVFSNASFSLFAVLTKSHLGENKSLENSCHAGAQSILVLFFFFRLFLCNAT